MSEWIPIIQAQPLFGMALTLVAYLAAAAAWKRLRGPALLHPVLVATVAVAIVLVATDMPYEEYFSQTLLLNETLALIIVLLAVPLYRQCELIRAGGIRLGAALAVGSVMAISTALIIPALEGVTGQVLATLAPKSATAAVAVGVTERLGGVAGLTAVVVISTGIFGAVFGPSILRAIGVRDDRAVGFALGVASHAIGTARAFQISEVAGAFASVGMILNALLTIVLAPVAIRMLA